MNYWRSWRLLPKDFCKWFFFCLCVFLRKQNWYLILLWWPLIWSSCWFELHRTATVFSKDNGSEVEERLATIFCGLVSSTLTDNETKVSRCEEERVMSCALIWDVENLNLFLMVILLFLMFSHCSEVFQDWRGLRLNNKNYFYLSGIWLSGWKESWEGLLVVTDVWTPGALVNFRVKFWVQTIFCR